MEELLTTKQAAEMLNMSPRTLEYWRENGVGLAFVKLGHRTVMYKKSTVAAHITERTIKR